MQLPVCFLLEVTGFTEICCSLERFLTLTVKLLYEATEKLRVQFIKQVQTVFKKYTNISGTEKNSAMELHNEEKQLAPLTLD